MDGFSFTEISYQYIVVCSHALPVESMEIFVICLSITTDNAFYNSYP